MRQDQIIIRRYFRARLLRPPQWPGRGSARFHQAAMERCEDVKQRREAAYAQTANPCAETCSIWCVKSGFAGSDVAGSGNVRLFDHSGLTNTSQGDTFGHVGCQSLDAGVRARPLSRSGSTSAR
jgi:hypothetical protein